MKFIFRANHTTEKYNYRGYQKTSLAVYVDVEVDGQDANDPEWSLRFTPQEWEALKQILGAGAVAMQMQGQDIQVEVK